MLRWAVPAGIVLTAFGAAAQDTNVRFEARSGTLELRAKIYTDDGDRVVETGELKTQQIYTVAKVGDGIPPGQFTIVTVCSPDYPGTTGCPVGQLPPAVPRFYVQKDGVGIASSADGTTSTRTRINGYSATTGSTERIAITFNCSDASCGPGITSGRIILNKFDGTPRTVRLYPTSGGTIVGDPIVVTPGGTNPPGISATFSGGTATINLAETALAGLPRFDGFQIGSGSANARFTFRLADMSFKQPEPDFVDFGCRIDLAQSGVPDAFKFTLAATSSEKFCPQDNDGVLKLGCSGKIPGYSGGAVTSSDGVVCRISGSQCGFDRVFEANVNSIDVKADGTATLDCEVAVGG